MTEKDSQPIEWDAYASQYDLLATNNPSYRENVEIVRGVVARLGLGESSVVCDVGGGTGNFICALALDLPSARFVHLDANQEMNRIANEKFLAANVGSFEIVTSSVLSADFEPASFDLVICINALYAMYPQEEVLRRIRSWIKPEGHFVVIDFGRPAKVFDWGRYILGNMLKERGLAGSIRFVWDGKEALRQNRLGAKGQARGVYWLHSTEEFGQKLSEAGFSVEELQTCYRGYCDFAVCRNPSANVDTPPLS